MSEYESVPSSWFWAVAIPGLAFGLISLQAGLDLRREGGIGELDIAIITVKGALLGAVGVAVVALLAWGLTKPFGGKAGPGWAVRAFSRSYAPTLVYAVCGIALNVVLGWNTAVACGVTGLLWALGPLLSAARELSGGRAVLGALVGTICGGALLFAWGLFATG